MPECVCTELHSGFRCCKECFSIIKGKYHGRPNPGSFLQVSTFLAKMYGTVCFSRRVRGTREGCRSVSEVALWSRVPDTLRHGSSTNPLPVCLCLHNRECFSCFMEADKSSAGDRRPGLG